jgi:F-type H+-transporting ATPase subunit b
MVNAFTWLVEVGSTGQIEQIARTFGVDWPHLIAQMISFGIVCFLLYRFAYRPILKILGERRQLIAQSLANSEKIKAELAQTEAQRQQILVETSAQAERFLDDARRAVAHLREQEAQKAIAAAEQIVNKAHERAVQDRDRMLAELKRDVGRLVVRTAAAVTGKILTNDDQQRLAEETVRQLVP